MNLSIFIIYFINSLILIGLVYLGFRKFNETKLYAYYFPALFFKVICTIALGLLYTQYYQGGDITNFFKEAEALSQLSISEYVKSLFAATEPHAPRRSIYFVRIASILIFITKSDFWLASLYFSLISFFGTFYFLHQLNKIYPKTTLPAVISFLFIPSIVFWSSGLIKEALVFGSMLFLLGFTLKTIHYQKLRSLEIPIALCTLMLFAVIKYYIAAVLIPFLIGYFLFYLKEKMELKRWYFISAATLLLVIVVLPLLHPNMNPKVFFIAMETARALLIENSKPEAIIYLYTGSNLVINALVNFPMILFSGLFRPTIFEALQFPNFLAGIENTILLFLFISRFFGSFHISKKHLMSLFTMAGYVLALTLFLTYSSPNFGTLSRFKIYYMPFFIFLILLNHPIINWLKGSKQSDALG